MLKFYNNPVSSNSQKVHYFLLETGIPFESKPVDLRAGQQLRPEFIAVNPFGTVPAIELGSERLGESNTILRYLAQRFGKTDWYPPNLEDQARVDQAMDFTSQHIARWYTVLNWYLGVAPMLGLPINQGAIDEAHQQLQKCLPRFERYMASTTTYLCGDHLTIADAALAPTAAQAKRYNVPLGDFPLVSAYFERLTARPAWQSVMGEMMKALKS